MLRILVALALALPAAAAPGPAPSPPRGSAFAAAPRAVQEGADAVRLERALRELESWAREVERGRRPLDGSSYEELRTLLRRTLELRRAGDAAADADAADPDEPPTALDALLLDLATLGLGRRWERRHEEPTPLAGKVRDLARRGLAQRLDDPIGPRVLGWLRAVLSGEVRGPDERRVAAGRLLADARVEAALPELLEAAREEREEELRGAVLSALAGWAHPGLTAYLLEGVSLGEETGRVPLGVLEKHLRAVVGTMTEAERRTLAEAIAPHLTSESWREAARALELVRLLEGRELYPLLIDALDTWAARRGTVGASRRIETDVADELQRRTGRAIGPHPDRWERWWSLVESGQVAPPDEEPRERSEATFFTLRPSSDRVTFVIDRSGSMSSSFGKDLDGSRYEQAIRQTLGYLRASGERTRFNLILFSDETVRWKSRLEQADERTVERAEKWLRYNAPRGGTHLREAVESALELDRDGRPDLSDLETDTIVVLCDGDTHNGPDWVAPTLERVLDRAQVVFHCVQIGRRGDGTLERLAAESGGDFVRVAP